MSVLKVPTLVNEVAPMVQTSLSTGDMVSLATSGLKAKGGIQQERFPQDNNSQSKMINGIYYLSYNSEQTKSDLHKWIFGE